MENVCKNAGRCVNMGNSHKCECQPGYTGSYCEEMVDECKSNPCRNGATCKDYQGTYECIVSTLTGTPLLYLFTWVPHAVSRPLPLSLLQCKPGYQGVNCEYEVDECHSKPCLHGGTCINLINQFTCVCPPGTHGKSWIYGLSVCGGGGHFFAHGSSDISIPQAPYVNTIWLLLDFEVRCFHLLVRGPM